MSYLSRRHLAGIPRHWVKIGDWCSMAVEERSLQQNGPQLTVSQLRNQIALTAKEKTDVRIGGGGEYVARVSRFPDSCSGGIDSPTVHHASSTMGTKLYFVPCNTKLAGRIHRSLSRRETPVCLDRVTDLLPQSVRIRLTAAIPSEANRRRLFMAHFMAFPELFVLQHDTVLAKQTEFVRLDVGALTNDFSSLNELWNSLRVRGGVPTQDTLVDQLLAEQSVVVREDGDGSLLFRSV